MQHWVITTIRLCRRRNLQRCEIVLLGSALLTWLDFSLKDVCELLDEVYVAAHSHFTGLRVDWAEKKSGMERNVRDQEGVLSNWYGCLNPKKWQ